MPIAGKVFVYVGGLTLREISDKLEGYRVSFKDEDLNELVTDIDDTLFAEGRYQAIYRFDSIVAISSRLGIEIVLKTTITPILFIESPKAKFLLVLAKKNIANRVATELSKILHGNVGAIVKAMITPEATRKYYESSEGTKVLLLDGIPLPNMNKMTMYGGDVVQTTLYGEYIGEGEPWYAVFKVQKLGYTVGLVRDGSVTVFNSIEPQVFVDFIEEYVFPLVLIKKYEQEVDQP